MSAKKLSSKAYEIEEGEVYEPYTSGQTLPEFTFKAVLSGIVIAAVWSLLRPRELLELWSMSRPQALVGWTTLTLVLALAPHVEEAILVGILMAGAIHLLRQVRLDVTTRREDDTLHVEPHGNLWFGSAHALEDELLALLASERDVSRMVIHCGGLGRIDLTGAWTLARRSVATALSRIQQQTSTSTAWTWRRGSWQGRSTPLPRSAARMSGPPGSSHSSMSLTPCSIA